MLRGHSFNGCSNQYCIVQWMFRPTSARAQRSALGNSPLIFDHLTRNPMDVLAGYCHLMREHDVVQKNEAQIHPRPLLVAESIPGLISYVWPTKICAGPQVLSWATKSALGHKVCAGPQSLCWATKSVLGSPTTRHHKRPPRHVANSDTEYTPKPNVAPLRLVQRSVAFETCSPDEKFLLRRGDGNSPRRLQLATMVTV